MAAESDRRCIQRIEVNLINKINFGSDDSRYAFCQTNGKDLDAKKLVLYCKTEFSDNILQNDWRI